MMNIMSFSEQDSLADDGYFVVFKLKINKEKKKNQFKIQEQNHFTFIQKSFFATT